MSSSTSLLPNENSINAVNYGSTNITPQSVDAEPATQSSLSGATEAPPLLRTLLVPRIMITMASYGFLAFVDKSVQALLPLVCSTSIPLGGLGLDPYRIGIIMGTLGSISSCFQFLVGPTIRRFGARKSFIVSQMSWIVVIGFYPLLTYCARRAGRVDATVWVILIIQLTFQMTRGLAYGK